MSSHPHAHRKIVLALCVALASLVAAAVVVPVVADDAPSIAVGAPSIDAAGPVGLASTLPLSITVPHPYPPISHTRIVYGWPLPWWCEWPTPLPPTAAPGAPTRVPPTPVPSPTPGGAASAALYEVCPQIASKVPAAVQQQALAAPWTIYGYNLRRNPNVPAHPIWNPLRTRLGLMDINKRYGVCNPVVWKAGCP